MSLAEFCISRRDQVFIRKVEGASAQGRAVLFWVPLRRVVRKNHLVNNSSDADEAIGIKFEAVNFKYPAHLLSSTSSLIKSKRIHPLIPAHLEELFQGLPALRVGRCRRLGLTMPPAPISVIVLLEHGLGPI